jgi:iron complex transport system permease protein
MPLCEAYLTRERFTRVLIALALLLGAVVIGGALIGSERIDLGAALFGAGEGNVDAAILFRVRLPRVLMAVIVGAALAASGTVLQALLRNPLAEPHLLGVSGGAAFGGVVALVAGGATGIVPAILVPIGSFAGAMASMLLVYRLGTVHGRLQPYTFLLAGVVCNAFTGALIMAVNALADVFQAQGVLFWLMGSLSAQSYWLVGASALYLAVGVLWLMRHTRAFNVLSLGEEGATHLGVPVGRVRRTAFVVSSLLVGAAVSISGMIGFVGLIVPHVARLLLGADYRLLLPASALLGGAFLLLADTVARSAFDSEIPVGVVTALCGGPFFIYLLRREGGRTVD